MIGLSAGRPHPLVVRAMKIARHRKAPTLAIVDATLSEVAKLADRTLYYSSNSPAFVRSHSGLLVDPAGARVRRLLARHVAVRRAHPGVQAQVTPERAEAAWRLRDTVSDAAPASECRTTSYLCACVTKRRSG